MNWYNFRRVRRIINIHYAKGFINKFICFTWGINPYYIEYQYGLEQINERGNKRTIWEIPKEQGK